MKRLLVSGMLLVLAGGSAFAQSSFIVGKATASGPSAFAAVSASTFSSSSSSGSGTSTVKFKGVSSGGAGGGVSYKTNIPPTSNSCTGFCALFR
jgi:hypothetical protein